MGRNSRRIKDRACELAEGYDDARDEAFNEEFRDMFTSQLKVGNSKIHFINESVTEDDIRGFLDSFSFDEENEWAMAKALSELDDIGDQKYEQMRDERYEQD